MKKMIKNIYPKWMGAKLLSLDNDSKTLDTKTVNFLLSEYEDGKKIGQKEKDLIQAKNEYLKMIEEILKRD